MKTQDVLVWLPLLLLSSNANFAGQIAFWDVGEYYYKNLTINTGYSQQCNESSSIILLETHDTYAGFSQLEYDDIGEWVYTTIGHDMYRVNFETTQLIPIPFVYYPRPFVLCPQEGKIVYAMGTCIYSVPMAGAEVATILFDHILNYQEFIYSLAYDLIVHKIFFVLPESRKIYKFDADGSNLEYVAPLTNFVDNNGTTCYNPLCNSMIKAYNGSVVFTVYCDSGRNYLLKMQSNGNQVLLHDITLPIQLIQHATITGYSPAANVISWSTRLGNEPYQYLSHSATLYENNTLVNVVQIDITSYVHIFDPVEAEMPAAQELKMCSLSGKIVNGSCECDANHYGPTCSNYCNYTMCGGFCAEP